MNICHRLHPHPHCIKAMLHIKATHSHCIKAMLRTKVRAYATMTRGEYADADDDAYDRAEARKKEAAANLNRLFYTDYTLSVTELKDLILQTFKKLNVVKIMLIDKQFMLVVYPEIKSPNDTEYMKELNLIAELLSDFTMKNYVHEEFKKIKEYRGEILYIPLQIKNVL